jgi:hypothetical protein
MLIKHQYIYIYYYILLCSLRAVTILVSLLSYISLALEGNLSS